MLIFFNSRGGDDGDARADGVDRYDEQDAEDILLRPREVVVVRVQQHVPAGQRQRQHLHHRRRPTTPENEPRMRGYIFLRCALSMEWEKKKKKKKNKSQPPAGAWSRFRDALAYKC